MLAQAIVMLSTAAKALICALNSLSGYLVGYSSRDSGMQCAGRSVEDVASQGGSQPHEV